MGFGYLRPPASGHRGDEQQRRRRRRRGGDKSYGFAPIFPCNAFQSFHRGEQRKENQQEEMDIYELTFLAEKSTRGGVLILCIFCLKRKHGHPMLDQMHWGIGEEEVWGLVRHSIWENNGTKLGPGGPGRDYRKGFSTLYTPLKFLLNRKCEEILN